MKQRFVIVATLILFAVSQVLIAQDSTAQKSSMKKSVTTSKTKNMGKGGCKNEKCGKDKDCKGMKDKKCCKEKKCETDSK